MVARQLKTKRRKPVYKGMLLKQAATRHASNAARADVPFLPLACVFQSDRSLPPRDVYTIDRTNASCEARFLILMFMTGAFGGRLWHFDQLGIFLLRPVTAKLVKEHAASRLAQTCGLGDVIEGKVPAQNTKHAQYEKFQWSGCSTRGVFGVCKNTEDIT